MHLFSSLITFFAFSLATSINASPIPVELSNSRGISVVVVRNNHSNLSGLRERHRATRDTLTWKGAAELRPDNNEHAALTSTKGTSMEFLAITGPAPGGPDWRRHSDGHPYTVPSL